MLTARTVRHTTGWGRVKGPSLNNTVPMITKTITAAVRPLIVKAQTVGTIEKKKQKQLRSCHFTFTSMLSVSVRKSAM